MPAVNADLMLQEMLTQSARQREPGHLLGSSARLAQPDAHAKSRRHLSHGCSSTPKTSARWCWRVPPGDANASLTGNIDTVWQTALEDVGLNGVDKGAGGKFVILPPGYKQSIPSGYTALPADTYSSFALLRSNLKSHGEADVAASIAYGKRVKVYPLSAAANPPETVFTDVKDIDYDSTIRYDASYFVNLDRIVQSEPWIERDRTMIDQLRSIGIEKGKPFAPSQATQRILTAAIAEAKEILEKRYDAGFPAVLPEQPMDVSDAAGSDRGPGHDLCRSRQIRSRRARPALYLRLHLHQTSGDRAVLPDIHARQGRTRIGRRPDLPPSRAARCPGQSILVGHGL